MMTSWSISQTIRRIYISKLVFLISALPFALLLVSFLGNDKKLTIEYNSPTYNPKRAANFIKAEIAKEKYFIVFVIPTMPEDIEIRNLFRSTWMNLSSWGDELQTDINPEYLKLKTMFILGREQNKTVSEQVSHEIRTSSDMFVFQDVVEHRISLKYKILWGMNVATALFDYSYLVKLDTDTFVDLPKLIRGLSSYRRTDAYTGKCNLKLGGFDSRTIPLAQNYTYCSGAGYVLSRDLVESVFNLNSSIRDIHIVPEDAYVGWLVFHVKQSRNMTVLKSGSADDLPQISRKVTNVKHRKGICQYNHWFQHKILTISEMRDLYRMRLPKATIF